MMHVKRVIFYLVATLLIASFLYICFLTEESYSIPTTLYQVYLDGNKLGLIDSKENLYKMINEEQKEIKNEYKVDQVYPPKGFQIVKKSTYDENISKIEDIYNSIKDSKTFTIKGYTVTIKTDDPEAEPSYIYVIDDNIFKNALKNVVTTFIGKERFNQYMTNTQSEVVETGYIIETMYFKDNISIKESYISVDEKIYTDEAELTKYLLFGENESTIEYTVKKGDTIEDIATKHRLNIDELLIANDNLTSEDTLLAIGETINVALISPVLSLVYDELITEDVVEQYQSVIKEDPTKYVDYREVTTKGSNGINRTTSRIQFTNGERNQGGYIVGKQIVIKPVVNEVITKGTKKYPVVTKPNTSYVDSNQPWAWPTNSPYVVTSEYAYRWGTLHDGMDISGTGYGSPIYAALDGEVVSAQYGGMVGRSAGLNVVIKHANGYYTVYAHCSKLNVKKGDYVKRRQKIAEMGKTGVATGTHLHFGVFDGPPYNGGKSLNPRKLWK